MAGKRKTKRLDTHEVESRILDALDDPGYRWRSPVGIARDAELPLEVVEQVLERNHQRFVRTLGPKGQPLYATKEHYEQTSSQWSRILSGASRTLK